MTPERKAQLRSRTSETPYLEEVLYALEAAERACDELRRRIAAGQAAHNNEERVAREALEQVAMACRDTSDAAIELAADRRIARIALAKLSKKPSVTEILPAVRNEAGAKDPLDTSCAACGAASICHLTFHHHASHISIQAYRCEGCLANRVGVDAFLRDAAEFLAERRST